MGNREDGKSLFEDAMLAREAVERRKPTSFETKPLMAVASLMAAVSAYFAAEPVIHAGLIVAAFFCGGMTLTLRWDRRAGTVEFERGGGQG